MADTDASVKIPNQKYQSIPYTESENVWETKSQHIHLPDQTLPGSLFRFGCPLLLWSAIEDKHLSHFWPTKLPLFI